MVKYTPIEHKAIRMEKWTGIGRVTWLRFLLSQKKENKLRKVI